MYVPEGQEEAVSAVRWLFKNLPKDVDVVYFRYSW
jgi:hypothetical protein